MNNRNRLHPINSFIPFLLIACASFGQDGTGALERGFQVETYDLNASYPSLPITVTYKESGVKRIRIFNGYDDKLHYQLTIDTAGKILSIVKREEEGLRYYIFNSYGGTDRPLLSSFVLNNNQDTIIKDTVCLQAAHLEHGDTLFTINNRKYFYYRSGKYLNAQHSELKARQEGRNNHKDEIYRTDFTPDSFYLCQVDKDAYVTALLKSSSYQFRPVNLSQHLTETLQKGRSGFEWTRSTPFIQYPYRVRYTNLLGPHKIQEDDFQLCGGLVNKYRMRNPVRFEIYSYNEKGLRTAVYRVTLNEEDYKKYYNGELTLKDEDKELLYKYEYLYFDQ